MLLKWAIIALAKGRWEGIFAFYGQIISPLEKIGSEGTPLAIRRRAESVEREPASSTNLGDEFNSIQRGGDANSFAVGLLDPHDRGLAEGPTAWPQTEAGREHDDQFELRARFHSRLRIEEDSRRTEIASDAFVFAPIVTNFDGHANGKSPARTPVGRLIRRNLLIHMHMAWKCTPVWREAWDSDGVCLLISTGCPPNSRQVYDFEGLNDKVLITMGLLDD
jgi:hypothetical protein